MSLNKYQAYNTTRNTTPNTTYHDDYFAMQDLAFENAPNVYYGTEPDCVEYEYEYGTNKFKPIPVVRVDEVIGYNTGLFDKNDFKVLIFKNDFFKANDFVYGSKFRWKNNIWLVINASTLNGMANSVEIRRCNNIARFYDAIGNEVYEPCILDIVLRFTRNQYTAPITTSNGEQKMWIQRNANTNLICSNTRFLFGPRADRSCWKVYGSGSKNYLNTITNDDNSRSLNEIYMTFDQVDEQRDDIVRGFADARVAMYSIVGSDFSGEYKVGDNIPLDFVVYKANDIINEQLVYNVDNKEVAVVNNGIISILNNGVAVVTIQMANNSNIKQTFTITVVESPVIEYQIKITPQESYILQGQKQTFECGLYRNGALDNTVTTFSIKDVTIGVPKEKYIIKQINSHSFEIHNKGMFMAKPLVVQCSTGDYSQEFSFELRGVY